MKKIYFSFFGFFCCLFNPNAFAQNNYPSSPFKISDSIHISGKIVGFNNADSDQFISFTSYGILGDDKKVAIQPKEDGTFSLTIFQPFVSDMLLNYKTLYVNLYVGPGKNIVVTVDQSKINELTNNKGAFLDKGDYADVTNLVFKFQTEYHLKFPNPSGDIGNKTQADSTYAHNRTETLNLEIKYLDSFITQNHIKNKVFENWENNQLKYSAAANILLFPFFGKINRQITHNQLLKLINSININNFSALSNSAYYGFLSGLAKGEQIIINVNSEYDSLKKVNGYNQVLLYLDKIDEISSGLTRELLYVDTYPDNPKSAVLANRVWDRFISVIKDPYLAAVITKKKEDVSQAFVKYNVLNKLCDAKVSDSLKLRLIAIFEKEKGNNLYIDFWGKWCGVCMLEMPNYPKLIFSSKTKPIKFIFFTTYTSDRDMIDIKQTYGINAEFINLTKNEVSIMNNVFDFHSYPSHFLLDKDGMVINNNLGTIGNDKSLESVVKIINSTF